LGQQCRPNLRVEPYNCARFFSTAAERFPRGDAGRHFYALVPRDTRPADIRDGDEGLPQIYCTPSEADVLRPWRVRPT